MPPEVNLLTVRRESFDEDDIRELTRDARFLACINAYSQGGGITLTWLVSEPLLIEYEAVMTRHEHLAASRLSVVEVKILLDAVAAVVEPAARLPLAARLERSGR